ncbi:hypothetical protein PKB_3142 [Pseudomonas knackmussii B13]|uniref:DUF1254 domain-containing protein n=1 Tax=Pseudomonas knackmussii (strain DSM 6978 / CCUG 54928 / LMG 23759 / B13) TaxID=1301098 RepID=A0A024HIN7_PSEKB|nr:DUF1254 domain-containing protein [Pseudomonas knackmussii]CDF84489.1 hypothetical protein PKB_3142 [Pseudomonas knackmussii B13]
MSIRPTPWTARVLASALLLGGLAMLPLHGALANATPAASQAEQMDEFRTLVRDVYQYAYPMVLMDITRQQMTNVPDATSVPQRAPINQFAHYRAYPDVHARDVVRLNFDTLYSMAWIDVRKEPVILSLPDTHGRYYLMPMLDMWTDVFAVPGTRTTGNQAGNFALASADWKGELPEGVELIRTPTPVFWIIGRTQANGSADYDKVNKLQDEYRLVPLSQWGRKYTPPTGLPVDPTVDNTTPPLRQINLMSATEVLTRFAQLLKQYPPHASDYPILQRMRRLGLEPGKDFDPAALSAEQRALLDNAAKDAQNDVIQAVRSGSIGILRNGWNWNDSLGSYGTQYRKRALVALAGLGANLPEDALYPNAVADADGKPLSGSNDYVLRFDKGQQPPVGAFWSLTLYDKEGFQVANPLDRFALGSHDALKLGADGSLEIRIQHASPGKDLESNWLPAPSGDFQMMLRLYSPKPAVTNGQWLPPAIRKIN